MKTSTKLKTFLIFIFILIFAIITARYFIGLHFKKKFSKIPPPGIIVTEVVNEKFAEKLEKNRLKYPAEQCYGSSAKYTAYQ